METQKLVYGNNFRALGNLFNTELEIGDGENLHVSIEEVNNGLEVHVGDTLWTISYWEPDNSYKALKWRSPHSPIKILRVKDPIKLIKMVIDHSQGKKMDNTDPITGLNDTDRMAIEYLKKIESDNRLMRMAFIELDSLLKDAPKQRQENFEKAIEINAYFDESQELSGTLSEVETITENMITYLQGSNKDMMLYLQGKK